MMIRKMVVLGMLFAGLAVCAAAQDSEMTPQEKQVREYNKNRVANTEEYKQFDYYYYIYALHALQDMNADEHTKEFLRAYRNRRNYLNGNVRYQREGRNYAYDYNNAIDKLRVKAASFTQQEKDILLAYIGRPQKREDVFKDSEKYAEYEDIVFQTITREMDKVAEYEACVENIYNFRLDVANAHVDVTDTRLSKRDLSVLLKQYAKVISCMEDMAQKDALKVARADTYLKMPVAYNGKEFSIPLKEWREKLTPKK